MGSIKIGDLSISKIYFGNTEVKKIYYGTTEIYSAEEQLAAPTLSLNGDTLTIQDNSEIAESFDLYVDGVYATNVPASSYEYTQSGEELTITNAPYTQSGEELTIGE